MQIQVHIDNKGHIMFPGRVQTRIPRQSRPLSMREPFRDIKNEICNNTTLNLDACKPKSFIDCKAKEICKPTNHGRSVSLVDKDYKQMITPIKEDPRKKIFEDNSESFNRYLVEYGKEFEDYLRAKETKVNIDWFASSELRKNFIGWISDVVNCFGLSIRTFFNTISLADDYLAKRKTKVKINAANYSDLLLIGVTSLYISSKLNDIMPLTLQEITKKITHSSSISINDIIISEATLLQALDFKVNFSTPDLFLKLFILKLAKSFQKLKAWDVYVFISSSNILKRCYENSIIMTFPASLITTVAMVCTVRLIFKGHLEELFPQKIVLGPKTQSFLKKQLTAGIIEICGKCFPKEELRMCYNFILGLILPERKLADL